MEKNARGGGNSGGATSKKAVGGGGDAPVNIRKNIPVPGVPLSSNHSTPKRHQPDAHSLPATKAGGGTTTSAPPAINLAVQGKHPGSSTSSSAVDGGAPTGNSPPKKKKLSMAEVNTRRAELLAQIRKQKQEQDAATAASK